jgi:ribulose 1,5-bisphosphate synthetase/thiazole synthase
LRSIFDAVEEAPCARPVVLYINDISNWLLKWRLLLLERQVVPDFDAIIIGTGQAGPSLAFRLAGAGMKVAVVERHLVGGTCVNTGCTPTKPW